MRRLACLPAGRHGAQGLRELSEGAVCETETQAAGTTFVIAEHPCLPVRLEWRRYTFAQCRMTAVSHPTSLRSDQHPKGIYAMRPLSLLTAHPKVEAVDQAGLRQQDPPNPRFQNDELSIAPFGANRRVGGPPVGNSCHAPQPSAPKQLEGDGKAMIVTCFGRPARLILGAEND
ncbi:MAG: hypothetical protein M1330_03885 [Armatimonadetes bacterium]|nr:hypothetical protein [Armatimonadota bacterium]